MSASIHENECNIKLKQVYMNKMGSTRTMKASFEMPSPVDSAASFAVASGSEFAGTIRPSGLIYVSPSLTAIRVIRTRTRHVAHSSKTRTTRQKSKGVAMTPSRSLLGGGAHGARQTATTKRERTYGNAKSPFALSMTSCWNEGEVRKR